MRNRAPAVAILVLSALGGTGLLAAPHVRATQLSIFESVDVPFVEGPYIFKNQALAQAFTASGDYRLTRVEAMVYDLDPNYPFNPLDPLDLSIRTDAAGIPSSTVLATARADGDYGYNWLAFDLAPSVNVTAGLVYWIVIEDNNGMNQNGGYKWAVKGSDAYPGGQVAVRGGGGAWIADATDDLLFRNWGLRGPLVAAGIVADTRTAGVWDPVTYTMCFNNTGTTPASYVWTNVTLAPNVTYLSDTAGAVGGTSLGSLSWQFIDVGVGPHSFQLSARVNPGIFDGLPLTTTLQVEYANETDQNQERTTASATIIARAPSLSVSKTVTPKFLAPGQNLTYAVGFVNSGSRPSPWVWVNDTLPPEVTYVNDTANALANFTSESFDGTTLHVLFTNLAQGAYSFDINARANLGLLNGTAFTNTVTVDFADTRGLLVVPSPSASATARIGGASIQVAKSANVTTATPGSDVRYQIRYENQGNATARSVWINDTLPAEVTYVSDTGGGGPPVNGVVRLLFQNVSRGLHYLWINVRVNNGTTDGTRIRNLVDLSYTDWDGSRTAPSRATADVTASEPILEVGLSGPATANPADVIDVAVRVANRGTASAGATWVNLTLVANLARTTDDAGLFGGIATPTGWRFSATDPGEFTFRVRLLAAAGLANGLSLNAMASVDFANALGRTSSGLPSSYSVIVIAPVFTLSISLDRASVTVGETVGLSIQYANTGGGLAADVWINVTIPEGVSVVNASAPWIATSGLRYIWYLRAVAPGSGELRLALRPDSSRAPGAISVATDLTFTDANGNPAGSQERSANFQAVNLTWSAQAWSFLGLLVVVTLLSSFIGYRVYGLGSRDKAQILQLFLLHRSGLLVKHYTRTLDGALDTDIVGAMLVAVQNFVRESFAQKAGELEEMSFANHKILLVHGRDAILAALVSGRYLERLKVTLRSGIERLEREYGEALRDWNGIVADLPGIDGLMDQILSGRSAPRTNGGGPVR